MEKGESYIRRVQLVAGSTYAVALPKHWAEENGVSKGSLVELKILPSGGILVEPIKGAPDKGRVRRRNSAMISFSADNYSSVLREIVSNYVSGVEVIELQYRIRDSESIDKLIEQLHNILLGVEVLEREPGIVKLYAVLDDYAVSFWDGFGKMKRAVVGMLETLETAIQEGDKALAEIVVKRDDIVDRLYLYLVRQLTRSLLEARAKITLGLDTNAEAPHIFLAIKSLERIGDHSTIIASILAESENPGLLDELQHYIGETREIVSKAAGLLANPDKEKADKYASIASNLRRRLRKLQDGNTPRLSQAASSLERINGYAQDIIEASIDIQTIRNRINSF